MANENSVQDQVYKTFDNGYKIVGNSPLFNASEKKTYSDYELVNPDGKRLAHADKVEDLEMIVTNPVFLDRLEKTGSISA